MARSQYRHAFLLSALVVAPFLLTGCQDAASDLASLGDGSTPVSQYDGLVAGLAVEDSEIQLASSETLARFDADGDGVLSEAERERACEARRAEFLERFDADGDGTLSTAERVVAREAAREDFVARFDTDGDGMISALERQQVGFHHPGFGGRFGHHGTDPQTRRKAFLERFDTDGDGTLSEAERAALRAQCEAHRPPPGGA